MANIKSSSFEPSELSSASLVYWSWVRCWVVCLGFRVGSYSFICNLGDVARVGIGGSVGDDLGTTIGKSDTVWSRCGIAVTLFALSEGSLAVIISYGIFVGIYWRSYWLNVSRSWSVIWSWWASWDGSSDSQKGRECDKGLFWENMNSLIELKDGTEIISMQVDENMLMMRPVLPSCWWC